MNGLLQSRRFWVTALSLAAVILKDRFGVDISDEQQLQIIALVSAWVVGDSLRNTEPKPK